MSEEHKHDGLRVDVSEKAFNEVDAALAKAIKDYDMSFLEIFHVLKMIDLKVSANFVRQVSSNTFQEGMTNIYNSAVKQKEDDDKRTGKGGYIG